MTIRHGSFEITPIVTGTIGLDGGAMFGVVPKPLWELTNPPDDRNRVRLATRILLVRAPGRVYVVDCGTGDKNAERFNEIYDVRHRVEKPGMTPLTAALAEQGVSPEDVTDVLLTHLHFDHGGGATRREGDRVVPTFPRAAYHLQEEHWRWANKPTERDRASFLTPDFHPLEDAGQLRHLDGAGEVAPGIEAVLVNGHTPGMQLFKFSDEAGRIVFYAADLWPFTSHVPLPFIMAYDLYPLTTLEEKKRFSAQAIEEGWRIFFEHDPECAIGRIEASGKTLRAVPEMEGTHTG